MLNPGRMLHLLQGQVGGNDQRFIAFIALINDGEEVFQGKVALLANPQIINNQQMILINRIDVLVLVMFRI